MKRTLLVFGAGGHGKVVAEAALASGEWAMVLATDAQADAPRGDLVPGVPVVAHTDPRLAQADVHVAIGSGAARAREAARLGRHRLVTVVHPRASLSPSARLAPGCFVAAQAVVGPLAQVGEGVILNHGSVVDHDCVVGDYTHVAPRVAMGGASALGARVVAGAGAVLLPGVHVGDDVILGAGAVVCADLPHTGTYVGVPARRVK